MVQSFVLNQPTSPEEPQAQCRVGRRGAARLRLAIPVNLLSTRATEEVMLLDLSRTGARVGLAEPLAPGEMLYLKLAGLELFAEVTRRQSGESGGVNGLVFDEPLTDAVILTVRRHAETLHRRERAALRDQARRWVRGEGPV